MSEPTLTSRSGLAGRRALVVGGGAGIGLATARLLAAEGTRLCVVDSIQDRAREAAVELMGLGHQVAPITGDVRQAGVPERVLAASIEAMGGVDILVNVVGRGLPSDLLHVRSDHVDAVLGENLRHHLVLGAAFARHRVDAGSGGSVVMVGSTSGLAASPERAVYGAAKAALHSLTRTMAVEWGPHGIRVNAVVPGRTRTDRSRPTKDEDLQAARWIPLGRTGDQAEVAAAIVFLASDLASYISGHTLVVDGGMTLTNAFQAVRTLPPNADTSP